MKMIDGLLDELEQEDETTRRVLERIRSGTCPGGPFQVDVARSAVAALATVQGNVAELAALDTIPEPPDSYRRRRDRSTSSCPSKTPNE